MLMARRSKVTRRWSSPSRSSREPVSAGASISTRSEAVPARGGSSSTHPEPQARAAARRSRLLEQRTDATIVSLHGSKTGDAAPALGHLAVLHVGKIDHVRIASRLPAQEINQRVTERNAGVA